MGKLVVILLLFFTFSFLFVSDHSFDQDLGRHLKLGEIIVQTHQIPRTNLFSYTNQDFPFINTHWLFEVFVYITSQTLGLQALLILKIIIILLAVWLTVRIISKESRLLLLPIGFIFLHVLRERIELRPEIFSFLFTAITLWILNKFTNQGQKYHDRTIFVLPLIQLIWINTHIYFFVGLILQAIFLIYEASKYLRFHPGGVHMKWLTIIFILSVLVSLINPNGITGLLYPLNVNQNYGYTIVENQNLFFLEKLYFHDPNFLFVKICAGLIILSLIIGAVRRTLSVKSVLLSITGLGLALMYVRSFPYLVFLSLPMVMENLGQIKPIKLTYLLSLITCLFLFYESLLYLNGDYYKNIDSDKIPQLKFEQHSQGAVDFVLKNDLPQPIFNNFDIGSYIIYRSYPKYRVFVDGRPEAYPASFFTGVYLPAQSDYKNFQILDQKINFQTVIFSHTDQTPWGKNFLSSVVKDQNWKLVYVDDFMVVLVKTKVAEEKKLPAIDLAALDPNSFRFNNHVAYLRIVFFLLNEEQVKSANKFVHQALIIYPDSPIANQHTSNYFW